MVYYTVFSPQIQTLFSTPFAPLGPPGISALTFPGKSRKLRRKSAGREGCSIENFEIGSRLRALRKKQGLSIAALAELSGVSTGLISQIEREMVVPTVVSIYRIAQALGTDIGYFFPAPPTRSYDLFHPGGRKMIVTGNGASSYELLNPDRSDRILDMVLVTLRGGEVYDHDCIGHAGEECGYVLSGVLTVLLNGDEIDLQPGDSISFSSPQPHKYINNGPHDCVSLWAMTPKFF